ncbi:unnamed protein product [Rotaria magnacalcarata]|uniref:G-protein coupled receptors family 2 profile 2 domain-containing protein n=1 Tax=Rotaria magnacalcarata TaxID=392030 RepID=A0A818WUX1_9BILA|nr:unnamed protein product [Rotaria magnacalcarata]CAF3967024.1 unnamed protein product [Rotaria magnacalcarata]
MDSLKYQSDDRMMAVCYGNFMDNSGDFSYVLKSKLSGLSIPLTNILISLFILFCFKSLYCSRTKIHVNLLVGILIQIIARLTTYGLQMAQLKTSPKNECDVNGSVFPYPKTALFDSVYMSIVYFIFPITGMFMWMLYEWIHLNGILTVNVFKGHLKTYYFHIIG